MKHLNLFSILFTLILLLLVPNLAAALLVEEVTKIPCQVNNSDRIVIGTVSKIDTYPSYTIYTISVKEWLYNPQPLKKIKVKSNMGSNVWVEDEVEFTKNESVLLMLKDENLGKQLFRVFVGIAGKRPVSDRDAVVKELKSLGKWPEENQTENKTNKTEVVENAGTVEQEENQTENKTNDTGMTDNAGTTDEQEESSNQTQKSNTTPFMSPVSAIAVILGAIVYIRRKQ